MEYPEYIEVCGNCGTLITWDSKGDAVCECGNSDLQFMELTEAKELGIL